MIEPWSWTPFFLEHPAIGFSNVFWNNHSIQSFSYLFHNQYLILFHSSTHVPDFTSQYFGKWIFYCGYSMCSQGSKWASYKLVSSDDKWRENEAKPQWKCVYHHKRCQERFWILHLSSDEWCWIYQYYILCQCAVYVYIISLSGCLQNNLAFIKRIVGASNSPVDTELWFAIIYNIIAVQHNNIFSMKSMVFEY